MLPVLDRITYYPRRGTGPDPAYVEVVYQDLTGYRSNVGFFKQWTGVWYRHEKDCS